MSQAAYDAMIQSATAHTKTQRFSCCSFEPRQMKQPKQTQLSTCQEHSNHDTDLRPDAMGYMNESAVHENDGDEDDVHSHHALWAHTDGAIYLVRELCDVQASQHQAIELFPALADAAMLRHFPQTSTLQETLWKQLPQMVQSLGKQMFKVDFVNASIHMIMI